MQQIPFHSTDFNDSVLLEKERELLLRPLPLAARRLAIRFGIDHHTALLLASLAGLRDGGVHD